MFSAAVIAAADEGGATKVISKYTLASKFAQLFTSRT